MPIMNFDLEDGKSPVSFSINGEGADRFMSFMAECQAIRDGGQAAIASQAPRQALSDAEIDDMIFGYAPSCPLGEGRDLARAIEAASGPNAALVAALKSALAIINNEADPDEYAAPLTKIRSALAAVGVEAE